MTHANEDRGVLTTERRHSLTMRLHELSTREAFDIINHEDATVAAAVAKARNEICAAIDLIADALRRGGRLIYVGAGTSGRLAVLDSAECPPTFMTDPATVQAIIAGGPTALTRSVEGAEDRSDDGAAAVDQRNVSSSDVVFGIATGGTTPFIHGALRRARQLGAKTVFLACVPHEQVADDADISIRAITGPEVLTGSTRMKAGTATKMVLNLVSTVTMVRLGKVYENLMIDVNTQGNAKLVDRGTRILQTITGLARDAARHLLDNAGGRLKTAIVMYGRQVNRVSAERLLDERQGDLGTLLSNDSPGSDSPQESLPVSEN